MGMAHITMCDYEELAHTAEVGMRVRAPTPAALFACAATGLFRLMGTRPGISDTSRAVVVESLDSESLLVDWLSELLYLHETTGEVYDRVEVGAWTPTRLEATVAGGRPGAPPSRAIKAITYSGLRLAATDGGWLAEVYVDV